MGDINDLVGKTIGSITVLEICKERNKFGHTQYLCKCLICGKRFITLRQHLKNGRIKTCGDTNCRHKVTYEKIIGQRFNRLIPISSEKCDGKGWWYLCKCDCGNTTYVRPAALKNGSIKSCGCYRRDMCEYLAKSARKQNAYEILGDVTRIFFNDGTYTEIDTDDYDRVKDYLWRKNISGYVITKMHTNKGGKRMFLHRLIANNADKSLVTHHIDHDILNNKKANLKNVSISYNAVDSIRKKPNRCGIRNIKESKYFTKNGDTHLYYEVFMQRDGQRIYVGSFNDLEKAVVARDKFCKEKNLYIRG